MDYFFRVGIEPLELVSWMENLRMWISQTILKRLVVEMDETNEQLIKLGLKEVLLGETGLEKVIKASRLPHVISSIPTLPRLLSFLELCHDQDYLVSRVRELACGGAMSGYRWNAGGKYKGVEWSADRGLPTDAELLMHCVNCYFDARLPPVEGVIDGRVFSTLHFVKETPTVKSIAALTTASIGQLTRGIAQSASEMSSSSPTAPSSSFAIIQTASRPAAPHFALRVGEGSQRHRLEVSPGRNNLFHTLLLFLHHVKTKEHGVLGRINLGRSGLNVLWVIE